MNGIVETGSQNGTERPKIVIAAFGTLGIVHPCLAIALALKARGFAPLLAVSASHCAKVASAGVDTVAIMPAMEEMATRAAAALNITEAEVFRRVMEDQDFFINRVLLDYLEPSISLLRDQLDGTVAIIGTRSTLAGPILAEKLGIPFVELQLQPMALFSADDPPFAKGMELLTRLPLRPLRMAWNRVWIAIFLIVLRRRYAPRVDAARVLWGLPKLKSAPFFQIDVKPLLSIGLWSSAFAPLPSDFAGRLELAGFPAFDSESGTDEALDAELQAFLAAGSRPLVFTLGSMVTNSPGDFYTTSLAAARALGLRAIFLAGKTNLPLSPDIIVREYVPHSLLFPAAALVVHHGGMGTTAQALRHAAPQLIVPHFLDQPDNGRRVRSLGVGDTMEIEEYTAENIARKVGRLLADTGLKARADAVARVIAAEDGGSRAAAAIAERLTAAKLIPEKLAVPA